MILVIKHHWTWSFPIAKLEMVDYPAIYVTLPEGRWNIIGPFGSFMFKQQTHQRYDKNNTLEAWRWQDFIAVADIQNRPWVSPRKTAIFWSPIGCGHQATKSIPHQTKGDGHPKPQLLAIIHLLFVFIHICWLLRTHCWFLFTYCWFLFTHWWILYPPALLVRQHRLQCEERLERPWRRWDDS